MRIAPSMSSLALIACLGGLVQADGEPVAAVSRAAADRTDVAVTIYNVGLGLVRETRKLTLSSGLNEVRYMDVAARINPRSVHLAGAAGAASGASLRVLEQNYEYDLISPEKLLERFVGRKVTLIFDQVESSGPPRQAEATLVSTNAGLVYEIDGRFHINPPARAVLPEIPGGLISAPTLVWLLESRSGGTQTVETSYLTDGISWSADYVGIVSADDSRLDLAGWVTIENASGTGFEEASLKLVAGDVHRAAPEVMMQAVRAMEADAASKSAFAEEAFFEYHLYTLDRRATVKDRQTKQIALMEAPGATVRKIFLLAGQPHYYRGQVGQIGVDLRVGVTLELANSRANGLGIPLPAGVMRLYKKDASGSLQFIGEDRIDHTPKDETITLKVGEAFDVVADRTQTDYRAVSGGRYDAESEFQIRIRNHKEEAVTVIVREPVPGDWKILSSSHPPRKVDAGTVEFSVTVPAGGEQTLGYRIAVDYR
ncbi:MAG TPA: DUF4139 domain-containing protein [Candidatus Polarisedimenticolia bacterium]|nr:DUF4139 domain-containing protein [Candidatus Polarisedimenticolia bacterium]